MTASTDFSGNYYQGESYPFDLKDVPQQFRFEVDRKKAARLVRNAENVFLYSPWLAASIKAHKGDMLEAIKLMSDSEVMLATFDGISLYVLAIRED